MSPSTGLLAVLFAATLGDSVESRTAQRSFGPGRCGPIDPVYVRTTTDTGGQPFPLAPSEVAQMGGVMAELSRSGSAMILWAGGTAPDADGGFVVPVDASVRRLTFTITFDATGGSAEIVRPDGAVVRAGAVPGDAILNCGRILNIDAPEVGEWRVTPTPSSRFWLVAHARSDRDLLTAEFVRRGGRQGHEGLFRIAGSPIAGRPAMLRVTLSGPEEGVRGTTADGLRYQRMTGRMYRAESVEVVPPVLDEVKTGADTPVEFTVRNYGGRVRYRATATVGGEVLTGVEPPVLDFATSGDQRVTVSLPARAVAAAGTSLELLVVAESEDQNYPSMNSDGPTAFLL